MGDYTRTTRECTLDSLRPDLSAEIRAHVEKYNLGDILSGAVMCIETTSVKAKKGLFGKEESSYTGAVLTKGWLLWTTITPKGPAGVLSARLNQITVQDYAKSNFAKMIPDTGLNVNGLYTDTKEAGSAFIGLEENAAGRKFMEAVIAAVQGQ
jgi:hypothetical protein